MHLLYWTVNDPYNIHLLQEDNILAANASIISAPFTGTQMDFTFAENTLFTTLYLVGFM